MEKRLLSEICETLILYLLSLPVLISFDRVEVNFDKLILPLKNFRWMLAYLYYRDPVFLLME